MIKKIALTAGAVAALAVAFAPAADAKMHRRHHAKAMMMGNPVMNAQGDFYATPPGETMIMRATGLVTTPVFTAADIATRPAEAIASPILMMTPPAK